MKHNTQLLIFLALQILQCLTIQGSSGGGANPDAGSGSSSGVSRAMVKDRFKTFNIQFEELHQRQSQWTVPDSELRESLRLAVAEVLLPAYRSFIKRFGYLFFSNSWFDLLTPCCFLLPLYQLSFGCYRSMIESGKNPHKYIRYTPEDLEHMLSEFFEGKTLNELKR